ncbi:MAG TPA: hypothetical protein VGJ05_22655 [Fimbriiglobus sp.]|jgi:hypothetical protein
MLRKFLAAAAALIIGSWAGSEANAQTPYTHANIRSNWYTGSRIEGTYIHGWPIQAPGGVIGPVSSPYVRQGNFGNSFPRNTYRTFTYFDPTTGSWVRKQIYYFPNR